MPAFGLISGGLLAELAPAHAQRMVAITDTGGLGLTALQACQAYIRALAPSHFD